ncbi:MAG: hypothetical protein KA327_02235 [Pseudarcicella sp.]|nr:hypothetical protein [Pseudarcicella sp.]
MKKVMLILSIATSLFLASCNQQELNPTSSADSLESALEASSAREAASTDSVTKKHCKGKLTAVDPSTLSTTINDYIATNYAGALIKFAGKDEKGQTVIGLTVNDTRTGLLFDANGVFVQKLERFQHRAKLTKIEIVDLPANVTAYITANYVTFSAKKAGKTTEGNYIVALKDGNGMHKVLKFDANGNFTQEAQIPPHENKPGGHRGRGHGQMHKK